MDGRKDLIWSVVSSNSDNVSAYCTNINMDPVHRGEEGQPQQTLVLSLIHI